VTPSWAPDGRSIVYSQNEGGGYPHLVRRSLSGTASEDLGSRGSFQLNASFTPDGNTVFFASESGDGWDILHLSLATGETVPVLDSSFLEQYPAVSPDGKWLAYSSTATGRAEVYLLSLVESEPVPIRISTEGGFQVRWRGDGKELFFVGRTGVVAAVPGPRGWESATLEPLFKMGSSIRGFDVAPDGQSFLISDETRGPMDDMFQVVVHP